MPQFIKIWLIIFASLLQKGQSPSIHIPNYLSLSLVKRILSVSFYFISRGISIPSKSNLTFEELLRKPLDTKYYLRN